MISILLQYHIYRQLQGTRNLIQDIIQIGHIFRLITHLLRIVILSILNSTKLKARPLSQQLKIIIMTSKLTIIPHQTHHTLLGDTRGQGTGQCHMASGYGP